MAASQRDMTNTEIVQSVILDYQNKETLSTMRQIAEKYSVSLDTVAEILKLSIPSQELEVLRRMRDSKAKTGVGNPMKGKSGQLHHLWKGVRSNGCGYKKIMIGEKDYFEHRVVMATMLGMAIEALPKNMIVHHIDGNGENNNPGNLVLCTAKGHKALHSLDRKLKALPH
jgi:hypothetical protein